MPQSDYQYKATSAQYGVLRHLLFNYNRSYILCTLLMNYLQVLEIPKVFQLQTNLTIYAITDRAGINCNNNYFIYHPLDQLLSVFYVAYKMELIQKCSCNYVYLRFYSGVLDKMKFGLSISTGKNSLHIHTKKITSRSITYVKCWQRTRPDLCIYSKRIMSKAKIPQKKKKINWYTDWNWFTD